VVAVSSYLYRAIRLRVSKEYGGFYLANYFIIKNSAMRYTLAQSVGHVYQ
jgi:hypothetical protein